jgi:hypothetical protein
MLPSVSIEGIGQGDVFIEPLSEGSAVDGGGSSCSCSSSDGENKSGIITRVGFVAETREDIAMTWLFLPCLVWLDLWLVVRSSNSSVSTASVDVDFVLFIVVSLLYRTTLVNNQQRQGGPRTAILLLLHARDAAMATMLLLALGNEPMAAYCVLLCSTVVLSLAVVAFYALRCDIDANSSTWLGVDGRSVFDFQDEEVDDEEKVVCWTRSVNRSAPR